MYIVKNILKHQKISFLNSELNVKRIVNKLKKLKNALKRFEHEIYDALKKDFNRTNFESYYSEIIHVEKEIAYFLKNIKKLHNPKKVKNSYRLKEKISSYVIKKPYGCVLITTPFSHPFLFSMITTIGAYVSGNKVILKLSPYSSKSNIIIHKIMSVVFSLDEVFVINDSQDNFTGLLDYDFDFVMFIGSQKIGKLFSEKFSSKQIPVAFLVGGKCPAIIDGTANLKRAAQTLIWGKLVNAGQSSLAPDLFLIHESIYDEFTKVVTQNIDQQFSENNMLLNYPCIINDNAFNRLLLLTKEQKIIYQKEHNQKTRQFMPTIIEVNNPKNVLMKEEIYGPIFTFVKYHNFEDLQKWINLNKNPVSIYCFSKNKAFINKVETKFETSSLVLNDAMVQIFSGSCFNGVKKSGYGSFRFKYSYDLFTYNKTIVKSKKNIKYFNIPFRVFKKTNKI